MHLFFSSTEWKSPTCASLCDTHKHTTQSLLSWCEGRKVGTMFRLSNAKPSSYVTCTNARSVWRTCKEPLVFDTKNTASVNDYHGSKQTGTGENWQRGRKWKIQQTVLLRSNDHILD